MSTLSGNKNTSFARREVVAPAGLWERGPVASGSIPPTGRSFSLSEAAQAPALAPTPEKHLGKPLVS